MSPNPQPDNAAGFRARFLVGPTAAGKSAVAQRLAEEEGAWILSADAMLVYRGMDIGTAKPTASERGRVRYFGIDLVEPDQTFSVGDYVRHAREAVAMARQQGRPLYIVGGSGLYIKCLTQGLDELPPADEAIRRMAERLLADEGVEALQIRCRQADPDRYSRLDDPRNPRRLIRLLEQARAGRPTGAEWAVRPPPVLTGLNRPADMLYNRIKERVRRMYEAGLLDEVTMLDQSYTALSRTALQAIGYREARAHLRGQLSLQDAMERTIVRTRRLAKKQMTWFRHQARVDWIDVTPSPSVSDLASRIRTHWSVHGPTPVVI